jgi:hypothetical protein
MRCSLLRGRQHIPDGTNFPCAFVGNDDKSAPHFSHGSVWILYFIPAINNGAVGIEEPYFVNG